MTARWTGSLLFREPVHCQWAITTGGRFHYFGSPVNTPLRIGFFTLRSVEDFSTIFG